MSRKSWHLDRRTMLRGMGVSVALPLLEGMSWAGGPKAPARPKRLCFVSFPDGCSLPNADDAANAKWRWYPVAPGRDYELTPVLRSLAPYREDLSLHGGLSHPLSRELLGHLAGDTWLTGGDVRGDRYQNTVSVDQVAALQLKQHTRYPSLTLSIDGGVGYKSRVSTLSFDFNGHPIPAEHKQRAIFERYFSSGGGDLAARRKSLAQGRKIVDLIHEDSKRLGRRLSKQDQAKLDEYLDSLNKVEEQIQRNEAWLDIPLKPLDTDHLELDPDPRVDPAAYVKTTYDLIALAFQADLTRVVTYQVGREDGMGFEDSFPNLALGIKRGHHTISHDTHEGHWEEWGRYDQWVADQFGHFVKRLAETEDEHGRLLDDTLVLYGSCCSTTHNARNYPLALLGGRNMGVQHGAYTVHNETVPMSNLLLSMLHAAGVEKETFSDATGLLPGVLA
ncbi:MAG: DUF1552 domain-containing protein [Planctomycetes bacterium]|nr:DUF1552 domain-containing protein [Planctomycetota bacterium]